MVYNEHQPFPQSQAAQSWWRSRDRRFLSIFHPEARAADIKALTKLMAHVQKVDEVHSTVPMMQVENETGLLGDSRDGSAAANKVFPDPIPANLLSFLSNDCDKLHRDLKTNLTAFKDTQASTSNTSWESIFGKGPRTDEMFMAYHYAHYLNEVAATGKAEYSIPLYTNVWLNYIGDDSNNEFPIVAGGGIGLPSDYPSGGAMNNVLDI